MPRTGQLKFLKPLFGSSWEGSFRMKILPVGLGRWRQFALDEIVFVPQLSQEGRNHLTITGHDGRVGRREVVLDQIMQFGQRMVGNHWKHMMLDVIVHIPIYETTDRIH